MQIWETYRNVNTQECFAPPAGGAGALGGLQGDICKAGANATRLGNVHAGEERWTQA